jgi:hypothetical protein
MVKDPLYYIVSTDLTCLFPLHMPMSSYAISLSS